MRLLRDDFASVDLSPGSIKCVSRNVTRKFTMSLATSRRRRPRTSQTIGSRASRSGQVCATRVQLYVLDVADLLANFGNNA
jgi:hypothetical protein